MDDLIKIQKDVKGNETVNARELHIFVESKQEFSNWIKTRIREYGFDNGNDYIVIDGVIKNPNGGRPPQEYHVTIDMAKQLGMVERNAKGRQIRQFFIDRENKLRAAESNLIHLDPSKNQPELLQLAADQAKQIKEQAPLVMIANNFLESSTLKTILQVSKELGIGEKKLFKFLREEKVFYYTWQNGSQVNVPYENHKTAGRFKVKNKTKDIQRSDGTPQKINYSQIRVTAKGEAYICALLKKRGVIK